MATFDVRYSFLAVLITQVPSLPFLNDTHFHLALTLTFTTLSQLMSQLLKRNIVFIVLIFFRALNCSHLVTFYNTGEEVLYVMHVSQQHL